MSPRRLLYACLALLLALHNDWWLWHDRSMVLGLPVGLVYHLVWVGVAMAVLVMLVRHAWPEHLETPTEPRERR